MRSDQASHRYVQSKAFRHQKERSRLHNSPNSSFEARHGECTAPPADRLQDPCYQEAAFANGFVLPRLLHQCSTK
ncbi:hypothetical protein SS50377_23888 [Spironucleus salmonicida]|uniref:Uncharacterized protein n=1 Tax=Spironucleus salmonicida TaxID=348837 RepID=V6LXA8_9EUKA|nr:hypothetical protein SS50377_23882 [Spironucleus salmonicida]KAH0573953.1 hypothetical protein SS50377_23888 [Spironucleus salmonicida]|eukprot:EST48293.1 Hypothetical protein SS50377_11492 [Spironucleus salmonicida]